jgi:hypothetical protein
VTAEDSPVLLPVSHPWDGRRLQRSYRGASLTASQGWLSFTPPATSRVATPWRLPIGTGEGMVHSLVHVRGVIAFGARGLSDIQVNRVAALDSTGAVLAFFLPGPEASSLAAPVDWFPDDAIAAFTQAAGLGYQQAEVHSPEELTERFPGLYEAGRRRFAQGLRWSNVFIYVGGGAAFVWLGIAGLAGSPTLAARVLFALLGLATIGVGVFVSPPVMNRLLRQSARRGG